MKELLIYYFESANFNVGEWSIFQYVVIGQSKQLTCLKKLNFEKHLTTRPLLELTVSLDLYICTGYNALAKAK
jgi:hypothetical protein